MANIFPLDAYVIVGLSIAEFITGMLKAAKPYSKYGKTGFFMFGACELVLGVLIGASIISEVTTLKYWYSKALYSMAVASDFLLLFFDLFMAGHWIWAEKNSRDKQIEWNRESIQEAVSYVVLLILIFLVPIVLMILLFGRLGFSSSDISVSELSDSATPPLSFWISFAGFILLFLSILFLFIYFALYYIFNCDDKISVYSFLLILSIGTPMIVGGGLRVSQQFVHGYALISITTIPPAMSFLITMIKFETIDNLATSPPNENSKQQNVESNEQDAI